MIKSLQSLRFLFALLIFLHHSAIPLLAFGTCPVSFFLMLSGFVLMLVYGERIYQIKYNEFIGKRLLRIYPTHFLCLLIAVTISFLFNELSQDCIIPLVTNTILLQAWVPSAEFYFSGNSVSWYLSVMLFCYCIFPWLVYMIQKHCWLLICMVLLGYFTLLFCAPTDNSHFLLYINPLARFTDFLWGMILCFVLNKNNELIVEKIKRLSTFHKTLIEFLAVLFIALTILISVSINEKYAYAIIWWIPCALLITVFYLFDNNGGVLSKVLNNKGLVSLGSVSFAFYMLHIQVLRINNYVMNSLYLNYYMDGIIVLSALIGLSYCVTYLYAPIFKK
ncbi:MAG: acyltransferase [Prevotella sp.]|nr:acyltransferase [Prevotella sp.]